MRELAGRRSRRPALFALALLLASLNLRPSIAAISPVLGEIRRSTGLSAAGAGLLTTLPLLCFGLLAPVAPRLVRRHGSGAVLLGCLGLLTVGIAVRSVGLAGLFAGTLLLGAAIAVANVLMPGVVKEDFPERPGLMTGLYTMALSAGPALAAGVSAPLAHSLHSWRLGVGLWAFPAALSFAALVPFRSHRRPSGVERRVSPPRALRRSRVAWAVTFFMGLQSLEFYSALAWLPTILSDRGASTDAAGALLAISNLVGIGAALVTPTIARRLPDARWAPLGSVGFLAAATAGLLFDPRGLDLLWVVLLGCGQGSAISLALLYMVLRTTDARQAMALSGMAQGAGYLIAAAGPATVGALYSAGHGWDVPLAFLLGLLGLQAVAGYGASRERKVGPARAS